MERRKDDVFMENEFKRTVAVFDLPCGSLMRSFKIDGETQGEKTQELIKLCEDIVKITLSDTFPVCPCCSCELVYSASFT